VSRAIVYDVRNSGAILWVTSECAQYLSEKKHISLCKTLINTPHSFGFLRLCLHFPSYLESLIYFKFMKNMTPAKNLVFFFCYVTCNVRITANVAPQEQENCLHKDFMSQGVTGILRIKIHRNQTFFSFKNHRSQLFLPLEW
jgi:hypothetical protein